MSRTLQSNDRTAVEDDWRDLSETIRDTAEGYAATDPSHAWCYRDEAAEFCDQAAPADVAELNRRETQAATLRRRWADRIATQRKKV